jgi:hypothetical protein
MNLFILDRLQPREERSSRAAVAEVSSMAGPQARRAENSKAKGAALVVRNGWPGQMRAGSPEMGDTSSASGCATVAPVGVN